MPRIRAICISPKRGTEKQPVETALLIQGYGIENDAHGGDWHRQVSLLGAEKVDSFNAGGGEVTPGAFGENLLVEGIDFRSLPVGTRFRSGDAVLEMTQIGKACHSHCQIYHRMGDCIMPREGVFARVLSGGQLSVGDELQVISSEKARRAAVITVSDRSFQGLREDLSGPEGAKALELAGYRVEAQLLLPDEQAKIEEALIDLCDRRQIHLVITTGGTGFSLRDVTPEATLNVATRNAPGIAEHIRRLSIEKTPRAMLSRAVSVIRNQSLIVNLPGSPKAVKECLGWILPPLTHGLDILSGEGDG